MDLTEMCSTEEIRLVTFYVSQDIVDDVGGEQDVGHVYSIMFADTDALWVRIMDNGLADDVDSFFWLLLNDENGWLDEYDRIAFTVMGDEA